MALDKQKLNTAYNLLKELVTDKGAFIIFVTKPGEGSGEDMQVNTFGPITTLIGLLNAYTPYCNEVLMQRINELMRQLPREPD